MWTNIGNETHPMMVPQWGPLVPEKYDHNYPMAHGSKYANLDSRAGKFLTGPGWDDKRAVPAPRGGTSHIVGDYEFGSGNGMYATTGVSEHKNSEYTWTDSVFFAKDVGVGPEAAGEAEHEYGSGWPMGNSAGPYPSKEWSRSNDGNWVRGVAVVPRAHLARRRARLGRGRPGRDRERLRQPRVPAAHALRRQGVVGGVPRRRRAARVLADDRRPPADRRRRVGLRRRRRRPTSTSPPTTSGGASTTFSSAAARPVATATRPPTASARRAAAAVGQRLLFQEATRGLMCGKNTRSTTSTTSTARS